MQAPPQFPDPADILFNRYTLIFFIVCITVFTVKSWMKGAFYNSSKKIDGKTVIVTGANTGIGYEVALDLARRGGRIILACRDEEKGKVAEKEIRKLSKNVNVYFMELDLASLQSVRDFCNSFLKKEDKLDILINNAGIILHPEVTTSDNFELNLQTNYLGPFLLTHLLLERLRHCNGRIVNVVCSSYSLGEINLDDLNRTQDFTDVDAYSQSKLALLMFSLELASRLKEEGLRCNAVHPGIVNTNGLRHMGFRSNKLVELSTYPFVWLLMKNPVDGAASILYMAVDDERNDITGKYIVDANATNFNEKAIDMDVVIPLWDKTLELVGLDPSQSLPPVTDMEGRPLGDDISEESEVTDDN